MRFYTKLLLVFALVSAATILVMLYFSLKAQRELVGKINADFRDVISSVHFSTQRLASEKTPDRDALAKFIQDARKNPAVSEVSVVNRDSLVVASSNPHKMGTTRALTGKEFVIRQEIGMDEIPRGGSKDSRLVVEIPILRDGQPIGLVQTALALPDYTVFLHDIVVESSTMAAAAFAGLLIVFSVVLFRLNRPLRQLTSAALSVGHGDLSVALPNPRNDEIGQLTEAFSVMVSKLAQQKELEDRLANLERKAILSETAAMLSHEIRNPLNLIGLTADHLAHECGSPIDEKKRTDFLEMIATLKSQVRQLNEMVNEFLAIGKPIKLRKSLFSAVDLAVEVDVMVRQRVAAKRIDFRKSIAEGAAITADREQMQLVLINLLLNALAAVSDGGIVELSIGSTPDGVRIAVTDNGPGVSAEDKQRIFEPYFSKRPGGTGLGLALAKRIVEQHGGTIGVSDAQRGGSCFEILLPKEG